MGAPVDKLYNPDGDFLRETGKGNLKAFESEAALVEHWGPLCKLMSRARGKPIQLNSGRWIEGPKAVRSEKHPLGLPWLPPRTQARVRKSVAMFHHLFRRLHLRLRNVGVAVIEHPVRSFVWKLPEAIELTNSSRTFFTVPDMLLRRREAEVYSLLFIIVPTCIGHFINQFVGVMTF